MATRLAKLRWAFSNRVVAQEITAERMRQLGIGHTRGFVFVCGELLRFHSFVADRDVYRVY